MSSKVVVITGAAGRIAYSLIPLILNGHVFGPSCKIVLRLLDIPQCEDKLRGIEMELDDSSFPLLENLIATSDPATAFLGAEVVILVGGFPRLPGMERRDLLIKNAESIRSQAKALNEFGSPSAKVLVVANPANTNCLVAIHAAPRIPKENFTCLTRLDQERLRGFCSKKLGSSLQRPVHSSDIHNVHILGNHSTTQVAYIREGYLSGSSTPVAEHFSEDEYKELLFKVQRRGAEIIKYLQVSSALSAAEAIVCHLRDWLGQITSESFSMGIYINNVQHVPDGIVFSLPCVRDDTVDAGYKLVDNLQFDPTTLELMRISAEELLEEKMQIEEYLK